MSRLEYGLHLPPTEDDLVVIDKRIVRQALNAWAGPGLTSRQHKFWMKLADAIGIPKAEATKSVRIEGRE